jgi:hypothetical protein
MIFDLNARALMHAYTTEKTEGQILSVLFLVTEKVLSANVGRAIEHDLYRPQYIQSFFKKAGAFTRLICFSNQQMQNFNHGQN